MHDVTFYVVLIAGMFAVTFPSRWVPLVVLPHVQIPPWIERWLRDIPTAIFAAMLLQALMPSAVTERTLPHYAPLWLGAATALALGRRTHSMLYGTAGGFGIYLLVTMMMG